MATPLYRFKCKACESWRKPFNKDQIESFISRVTDWNIVENKKIEKKFVFKNFKKALGFVNTVGKLAEKDNHHPNIFMYGWNKVKITLTTHNIDGLSDNDFILASKIDRIKI